MTEEIWAAASPNLARIKFCVEIDDGAEGGREPKAPLNAADNEGTIGALGKAVCSRERYVGRGWRRRWGTDSVTRVAVMVTRWFVRVAVARWLW